jgi:hypothetical protein
MLPWFLHLLKNKFPARGRQYPVIQLTAQPYELRTGGLLRFEVLSYNIALSAGKKTTNTCRAIYKVPNK